MKVVNIEKASVRLEFTVDELIGINNALNEICHNSDIDENDCHARLGIAYQETLELLKSIGRVIEKIESMEKPG